MLTKQTSEVPRKARVPVAGPDRGRVRMTDEPVLRKPRMADRGSPMTEAELQGPFEPHRLYRLSEIHEGLSITPLQAKRWMYRANRLAFVQMTGKGRRFRGRDLNRYINERVVVPEDR